MAMTIALRVIALPGSWNMSAMVSFQSPVSDWIERARSRK